MLAMAKDPGGMEMAMPSPELQPPACKWLKQWYLKQLYLTREYFMSYRHVGFSGFYITQLLSDDDFARILRSPHCIRKGW